MLARDGLMVKLCGRGTPTINQKQMAVRLVTHKFHNLLVRELGQVVNWDELGTYLGLEDSEIREIERDHQSTARRRIVMLAKWIEKDVDASWEKVIEALKSISQTVLALKLEDKYCTSEATPALPSAAAGPPNLKVVTAPDEIELLVDRQESIAQKIEDLEQNYLQLVLKVETAMRAEASQSSLKLKRFSRYYGIKLQLTTVEELFDELEPFNFLDYALLEKMVKFFLSSNSAVVGDLRVYLQQLAKFKSSTTLRQFMDKIERAQQPHSTRQGLCTITLRLVGGWLAKTMDDLEKLVKEIFKDKTYVLTHLKIVRGSIIVTYYAPLSEAYHLIFLAWTCAMTDFGFFLMLAGVMKVVVGGVQLYIDQKLEEIHDFEDAIHETVAKDRLDILMFLLSINTNPNPTNDRGQTALMYASYFNKYETVLSLLNAGADTNLQRNDGMTALNMSSQRGHTAVTKALLNANANPNLRRYDGVSPLNIASHKGYFDIVDLLLKAKADPDLHSDDNETPLFLASMNGHVGITSLLLKANANLNYQKTKGVTPLYMACQNGHTDIVILLLDANADPNLQADDGTTPLYLANYNRNMAAITRILEAKANPNLRKNNGITPLLVACLHMLTDAIALLLEANANPNIQRDDGTTPLHLACTNNHIDAISLLLRANANPNIQCDDDTTPLHLACTNNHIDAISLLLRAKANPNIQCDDGTTPLHMACTNNHIDAISLLLRAKANPNIQCDDGTTPLHLACTNNHIDAISLLLRAKANPNLVTEEDGTPLMTASVKGYSQVVQLLLASGADPNVQHPNGLTALMLACFSGSFESVELLVTSGADVSKVGSHGLTALGIAAKRGHNDIVDFLQATKLSRSSTTTSVLTANEIASNVDNKTMALLNRAMEQMVVKKAETFITTEYEKKLKKSDFLSKQYKEAIIYQK